MFGDPTIADAILDRLVHNAYRIELSGESLRKQRSPHRIIVQLTAGQSQSTISHDPGSDEESVRLQIGTLSGMKSE